MTKQVIVMRKDLNMRKGKMCAQAAHASMGVFTQNAKFFGNQHFGPFCFFKITVAALRWFRSSFKKVVVGADSFDELVSIYSRAKEAGLPVIMITDSGLTEFNGEPTETCVAIGPAYEGDIDRITGKLKLL